ncbi:hypothetical protein [Priestia koreensis]|uniref:hypothetical protein n=1 Tax=Priestia koreensis TaxID=284581 RepID=UPI000A4C464F|nr:hypothetical protein [Priestia koreensis]MCM3006412.1 hypothetical protein [Priestia koreensis]
MFVYITMLGFLGLLIYASTFAYSVIKRDENRKRNGKGALISFIIMIVGVVGAQFS